MAKPKKRKAKATEGEGPPRKRKKRKPSPPQEEAELPELSPEEGTPDHIAQSITLSKMLNYS